MMDRKFLTTALVSSLLFTACTSAQPNEQKGDSQKVISSYESCVAAGHPIMRSYPPKCPAGDGRIFVQGVMEPIIVENKGSNRNDSEGAGETCRNLCGNGTC
ncbi:MAG: hypothetical protein KDD70_16925, partial [Bdellovibrionales bacterium]|nr:hypothetical protein [Bdellovibrionales bacterium]